MTTKEANDIAKIYIVSPLLLGDEFKAKNLSKEFTNKQIELLKEAFEESAEWTPIQLEF